VFAEKLILPDTDEEAGIDVAVEDPSTGEVFAAAPDCGLAEVDRVVTAVRQASVAWVVRGRVVERTTMDGVRHSQ
jgi:acyl-CoA reductase-like NAD-dependent aldehyde dehydrogenase